MRKLCLAGHAAAGVGGEERDLAACRQRQLLDGEHAGLDRRAVPEGVSHACRDRMPTVMWQQRRLSPLVSMRSRCRGTPSACRPLMLFIPFSAVLALAHGPSVYSHSSSLGDSAVLDWSESTHCRPVPQVMSFFHYSRKCDKRQLSLPIEPLVGAMRHPFVIPACNPPVRFLMTGVIRAGLHRQQPTTTNKLATWICVWFTVAIHVPRFTLKCSSVHMPIRQKSPAASH